MRSGWVSCGAPSCRSVTSPVRAYFNALASMFLADSPPTVPTASSTVGVNFAALSGAMPNFENAEFKPA